MPREERHLVIRQLLQVQADYIQPTICNLQLITQVVERGMRETYEKKQIFIRLKSV
jgi:hypothetical protein